VRAKAGSAQVETNGDTWGLDGGRAKAGSAQVETNGDTWGLDGGRLSVCGLWNVDHTSGSEDAVRRRMHGHID
jgi:hypothetical protein